MAFNFKSAGGGSNPHTIRLKSGEAVIGVMRGDLYEFEKGFKPGDPPKFRFRMNLILNENGALVAKIFEGGWKVYAALGELQKAGWDLEKTYVRISRQGSGPQDTVYGVTTLPNPVPASTLEKLAHVKLQELREPTPVPQDDGPMYSDAQSGDDLPF